MKESGAPFSPLRLKTPTCIWPLLNKKNCHEKIGSGWLNIYCDVVCSRTCQAPTRQGIDQDMLQLRGRALRVNMRLIIYAFCHAPEKYSTFCFSLPEVSVAFWNYLLSKTSRTNFPKGLQVFGQKSLGQKITFHNGRTSPVKPSRHVRSRLLCTSRHRSTSQACNFDQQYGLKHILHFIVPRAPGAGLVRMSTSPLPDISTGKESILKLPVKKRVVSGVQPTGNLHFGNYLGAIKQWATNQVSTGLALPEKSKITHLLVVPL